MLAFFSLLENIFVDTVSSVLFCYWRGAVIGEVYLVRVFVSGEVSNGLLCYTRGIFCDCY